MRTIWKGSLSFGLVNIPVKLYSASQARELKFKLLHNKDLSEIRYARICKTDGKEIEWKDIVKGFEYEPGDYVIMTDEDFKKANLKKTKTIEILNFTEESEVDPIYYDTPYYLVPEKNAVKPYDLLREALEESKKVGIGNFVFKNHEHIGIVRPYSGLLILNQLRYHAELINPEELELPEETKASKKELDMAIKLIDQLTVPFEPENYADLYTAEVKNIIEKKAKGQKTTIKKGDEAKPTKIHDILSLLQESLKGKKQESKAKKTHSKKRKVA